MGPVPKTIVTICILAGATAAALTFRREPSRPHAKVLDEGVPLLMGGYVGAAAARPAALAAGLTTVGQPARPAALSKSSEPAASGRAWIAPNQPPALGRAYPGLFMIPRNAREPLIHAIVNGDTLEALAERYLGRADRAEEIFEANRTGLHDPEILPIGMKLTIPRGVSPPAVRRQPLVPVAAPPHETNQHAPRPTFQRF